MPNTKGRVGFIDCAKGIAIILVILGHTVRDGGIECSIIRGLIFSFHMPLFFMLSCYTYRYSNDLDEFYAKLKKSTMHLLVPAIIIFVVYTIFSICANPSLIMDLYFWRGKVLSLVYSSGVDTEYSGIKVPGLGMPWFFIALFLGRSLYDYLHIQHKNSLLVLCVIISMIGIILGKVKWLPFSLDIVLAIMPLFYIGEYMKEEKYNKSVFITMIIWVVTFLITSPGFSKWRYLEIAVRRYPLYPICFVCAVYGTLFICNVSKYIMKLGLLSKIISYIGKNSLYLFMIHCLDDLPFLIKLWHVTGNEIKDSVIRIVVDLSVFYIVMGIKSVIPHKIKNTYIKKQKN